MALDMWFKEDIRNILLGIELANAHLACRYPGPEVQVYREGFRAALTAIAVSFGIATREPEVGVTKPIEQMMPLPMAMNRPPHVSVRE